MMKRREFISGLSVVLTGALSIGCLGFSTGADRGSSLGSQQQPVQSGSAGAARRSSVNQTSISDINALSDILQRARCPLSEGQTNTLLKYRTPEEFSKNMMEVLSNEQIEAVKTSSGGRRRRGGGGRRR
ncbi:hypothetical protein ACFL6P_06390 [Candidatus Latescibacterota bacterium]